MGLNCLIKGKIYPIVQGSTFSEEYNETLDSGTIIVDQIPEIKGLKPYEDVFIFEGVNKAKFQFSKKVVEFYCESVRMPKNDYFGYNLRIYRHTDETFTDNEVFMEFSEKNEDLNTYYNYKELYHCEFVNPAELRLTWVKHISGDKIFGDTLTFLLNEDGTYYETTYYVDESTTKFSEFKISHFLCYQENTEEYRGFYKHFLIDQFSAEQLDLTRDLYKYKIELFSETKGLETIQLPNISITQPLNKDKKKSVAYYLEQFVDMYSPRIKVRTNDVYNLWIDRKKYEVDQTTLDFFSDVYSPDFTLNSPNLKDVLHQLMLVKDRIPKVVDGRIYSYDITARTGLFNKTGVNYITQSRSSDNHCSNLKRTYSNALSQDNTCRRVEYLGFRNSDEAMLTIENMRLETSFPIYKINKIYCCYYKKGKITKFSGSTEIFDKEKIFLCKQDITPLIKLNSERNLLSKDWNDFADVAPKSIDDLAQYKLCTLGYNIGDSYITGWGEKYTYPKGWWATGQQKTYFENIITLIDNFNTYGIYDYGYVTKMGNLQENEVFTPYKDLKDVFVNPFSNTTLGLKSFFFEVDYNGFYNGTIIHSKDGEDDLTTINDNSSSSLTLLEQDGLFEKEKINRFGNISYLINARYKNFNEIQDLGSVLDDDVVIYHKQFSVYNDVINCSYYGTKDYVLKNYFTSVYAKHRTYNLMSYGESVRRSENKKLTLLLSKNKKYLELDNQSFSFGDGDISKILSFIIASPQFITKDFIVYDDKINYGFMKFNDKLYALDVNAFASGYSMCFNLQMKDNVSAGVYISELEPSGNWTDPTDDLKGTMQKWYLTIDDKETGFAKELGFYVAHIDLTNLLKDNVVLDGSETQNIKDNIFAKIFKLPLIDNYGFSNLIGGTYNLNKDNKEKIDMTYQVEPLAIDEDIIFSQWMLKLSDLLSNYNKVQETYEVEDVETFGVKAQMWTSSYYKDEVGQLAFSYPYVQLVINKGDETNIKTGAAIQGNVLVEKDAKLKIGFIWESTYVGYKFVFDKVAANDGDSFAIEGNQYIKKESNFFGKTSSYSGKAWMWFWKVAEDNEKIYYSTIKFGGRKNFLNPTKINKIYYNKNGNSKEAQVHYFNATTAGRKIFTEADLGDTEPILNGALAENSNVYLQKSGKSEVSTYNKNIFVVESTEKIDKTIVYDELDTINATTLKVNDVFKFDDEDNIIVKTSLLNNTSKSVQIWFYDNGSYKFVFGINLKPEDFQSDNITIYTSLLSKYNTSVVDNRGTIIGNIENYVGSTKDKTHQYYEVKNE